MNDTTRLVLIREVLSTYTLNCEDENGDRNLADRSLCINALDDIANAVNPDLEDLERDGWISPATALPNVTVTSFGYGHQDEDGKPVAPPVADITIDVRAHFRDPHVSPGLRNLTGTDRVVIDAVMATPGVHDLIAAVLAAVAAFRAAPAASPVTVAVGCVGGRHRSVVIASFIAALLPGKVGLVHRDIGRPVIARSLTAGCPR